MSIATTRTESDCWEANLIVAGANILPAACVWSLPVLFLGSTTAGEAGLFAANFRLASWLYLVEAAVEACRTCHLMPVNIPPANRIRFALREGCSVIFREVRRIPSSIVVRGISVLALTAVSLVIVGQDSIFTSLVAFGPTAIAALRTKAPLRHGGSPRVLVRGTHIGTLDEARARATKIIDAIANAATEAAAAVAQERCVSDTVQTLPFGGVEIVRYKSAAHFLILGTPSSGKTLIVRTLIHSVFAHSQGKPPTRALLFDPKKQFYQELIAAGVQPNDIYIMNPNDERGAAWDIAADITTKDDADNLAAILVPEKPGSKENEFFNDALRALLSVVIQSHQRTNPGHWRLIDLINTMRTPGGLREAASHVPLGEATLNNYFTEAKDTVGGIISTIDARYISKFETIAQQWAKASRKVSLRWWLTSRSVLLLGTDANRTGVDRINQAIIERVTQLVCNLPDQATNGDETWFFLDEARFAGRLPRLHELVSFSRTKGGRVVMATQDIDGLCEVYGEHVTNEVLGLCGNVAVLRLTSPKTRDWAAKFFGEHESWETDYNESTTEGDSESETSGQSPSSTRSRSRTWSAGISRKIVKRESILPSEFAALPEASMENGVPGFFSAPQIGAWRGPVPSKFFEERLPKVNPFVLGFIPRSDLEPTQQATQPARAIKRKGRLPA